MDVDCGVERIASNTITDSPYEYVSIETKKSDQKKETKKNEKQGEKRQQNDCLQYVVSFEC